MQCFLLQKSTAQVIAVLLYFLFRLHISINLSEQQQKKEADQRVLIFSWVKVIKINIFQHPQSCSLYLVYFASDFKLSTLVWEIHLGLGRALG